VARVYEQRGFWKLTQILGIFRDLLWRRILVQAENEMNWKNSSNPDQHILRLMRCHRLLSISLCSKNSQTQKGILFTTRK
jgi:hypothetical protein